MKINWKKIAKIFERAAGLPFDDLGKNLKDIDDVKEALQVFSVAPNPQLAKNILDSVFAECDVKSMTRLDAKYEGWLNDFTADENMVKQVIKACDYLSDHDMATVADFYGTHVLWGAVLRNHYEEHAFANSARLIDYAHKALAQGQGEAATDCMYHLFNGHGEGDYNVHVQQELRDLYAKAMIAFIDQDLAKAKSWLDDERGVGGPNPSYEEPYYQAMSYLATKRRTEHAKLAV